MEDQTIKEEIKEENITEPQIDWHEKYLYLAADMENMRKRFNKQLNNAIEYGKEKRKPYTGAKAIDCTCRNHGSCVYCRLGRLHQVIREDERSSQELKDSRNKHTPL